MSEEWATRYSSRSNVFYRLPEVGGSVSLYIHTHLREDALQLFGFRAAEEKQVFLLLNSVSGIGPKLAINILSGIPAEELVEAVKGGDQLRLVSIPGVGKTRGTYDRRTPR